MRTGESSATSLSGCAPDRWGLRVGVADVIVADLWEQASSISDQGAAQQSASAGAMDVIDDDGSHVSSHPQPKKSPLAPYQTLLELVQVWTQSPPPARAPPSIEPRLIGFPVFFLSFRRRKTLACGRALSLPPLAPRRTLATPRHAWLRRHEQHRATTEAASPPLPTPLQPARPDGRRRGGIALRPR